MSFLFETEILLAVDDQSCGNLHAGGLQHTPFGYHL